MCVWAWMFWGTAWRRGGGPPNTTPSQKHEASYLPADLWLWVTWVCVWHVWCLVCLAVYYRNVYPTTVCESVGSTIAHKHTVGSFFLHGCQMYASGNERHEIQCLVMALIIFLKKNTFLHWELHDCVSAASAFTCWSTVNALLLKVCLKFHQKSSFCLHAIWWFGIKKSASSL